jgi:hypothetical protein
MEAEKVIPVVPPLSPIEVTVPKFEVYPAGLDELWCITQLPSAIDQLPTT